MSNVPALPSFSVAYVPQGNQTINFTVRQNDIILSDFTIHFEDATWYGQSFNGYVMRLRKDRRHAEFYFMDSYGSISPRARIENIFIQEPREEGITTLTSPNTFYEQQFRIQRSGLYRITLAGRKHFSGGQFLASLFNREGMSVGNILGDLYMQIEEPYNEERIWNLQAGQHTMTVRCTGKNASSANYLVNLTCTLELMGPITDESAQLTHRTVVDAINFHNTGLVDREEIREIVSNMRAGCDLVVGEPVQVDYNGDAIAHPTSISITGNFTSVSTPPTDSGAFYDFVMGTASLRADRLNPEPPIQYPPMKCACCAGKISHPQNMEELLGREETLSYLNYCKDNSVDPQLYCCGCFEVVEKSPKSLNAYRESLYEYKMFYKAKREANQKLIELDQKITELNRQIENQKKENAKIPEKVTHFKAEAHATHMRLITKMAEQEVATDKIKAQYEESIAKLEHQLSKEKIKNMLLDINPLAVLLKEKLQK